MHNCHIPPSTVSKIVAIGGVISFFLSIYNFSEDKPIFACFLLGGVFISYIAFKTPETVLIKSAKELDPFVPELQRNPYFYVGLALMIIPGVISTITV